MSTNELQHPVRYDLRYLSDPTVFAVGRLPAVSDHDVYLSTDEAEAGASSLVQSLNGQWKFQYATRIDQRVLNFYEKGYDCSAWPEIRVPGHIQLQGHGRPQYVNVQYPWDGHEDIRPPQIPTGFNPVGSYARTFDVPKAWARSRIVLTFHGVECAFFCWVNGKLVGYAEDSFTPSHFDITDMLCEGVNKLAVEVFRFSSASYLEDQDFWRFSGIFRDVTLSARPSAHVRDLFAHANLDDAYCDGLLDVELQLDLPAEPITLRMELLTREGALVQRAECAAQPQTRLSHAIAKPLQWSAEQPNLYALRLTLLDSSGAVREVAQTQIGFRRFELKDGVMQLNGKRILFHGVDRHEFCMSSGRALEEANMYADIRALKANNLNAVRTSHYPNNSFWYKLCDEYGIYLIDEANLETHGSWDQAKALGTEQWIVPNDNPQWLPAIIDRATSMQERDKNHPSVLIWSCGNESFGGRDIYEMSEHLRKRDPSRLVHYEGVCNDRRYNDTSDVESRMYPPAAAIAAYLEQHPEKPYILCEYTHAMGNSCGGMHKYVELEERFAQYQGGFIWDWIDQALLVTAPNGKPRLAYGGDFGDRPTDREFCGNGLLFADRTATPKMQEVKYLYQPIRLTPDESGVTIQNRHLFTNASAYLLHWSLLRNGTSIQKGTLNTLDVPAGEERRYALPVLAPCESGEYVLHCALSLRHTCDWAEADYELMHGDALIADLPAKPEASVEPYTITRGDHITGALGKRFEMLFSAAEGGLCSLRGIDNRELLSTAPSLSLFRAPTSNDRGNGDWQAEALWQASSVYAKGVLTDLCTDDGKLSLRFCYQLPLAGGVGIELRYTVLGDGKVRVDMDFPGKASLPDLPAFGLSLRLPRALRLVRYYGLGPQENYSDRKHGARLAAFSTTPAEGFTRNLRPQECGNHEGVRSLSVVDQNGYGLRVDQVDAPLSVSVLPYSASDIMNARHFDELAEPTYTYLDIAACRKGVGGDDSWGAPVHPEYHLPADRPYLLSFVLSVL